MNGRALRSETINQFLAEAGWNASALVWLDQDASTRRYARLTTRQGFTAILMDAPRVEDPICTPEMSPTERQMNGWNAQTRLAASRVDAFVLIAEHLRGRGLSPPRIFAHDGDAGLALIEDFGPNREFARLIEKGEADEIDLYEQAAALLARLHTEPPPKHLSNGSDHWPILTFDSLALQTNADLFVEWLPRHDPRMSMTDQTWTQWQDARDALIETASRFPRCLTLRDFHAENLLLLENGDIGLLDFQDAVIGWDAWDMAMLVQDARRDVSDKARQAAIQCFLNMTGVAETDFRERLAVIGTLNALRITGLFARLQERDSKLRYAAFMPRQQWHLATNLRHPSTKAMAEFVARSAPFIFEVRP
jgi:aminoglycoside/choline kinase family phosphotransferase